MAFLDGSPPERCRSCPFSFAPPPRVTSPCLQGGEAHQWMHATPDVPRACLVRLCQPIVDYFTSRSGGELRMNARLQSIALAAGGAVDGFRLTDGTTVRGDLYVSAMPGAHNPCDRCGDGISSLAASPAAPASGLLGV